MYETWPFQDDKTSAVALILPTNVLNLLKKTFRPPFPFENFQPVIVVAYEFHHHFDPTLVVSKFSIFVKKSENSLRSGSIVVASKPEKITL